jgi:hypothetical protein
MDGGRTPLSLSLYSSSIGNVVHIYRYMDWWSVLLIRHFDGLVSCSWWHYILLVGVRRYSVVFFYSTDGWCIIDACTDVRSCAHPSLYITWSKFENQSVLLQSVWDSGRSVVQYVVFPISEISPNKKWLRKWSIADWGTVIQLAYTVSRNCQISMTPRCLQPSVWCRKKKTPQVLQERGGTDRHLIVEV